MWFVVFLSFLCCAVATMLVKIVEDVFLSFLCFAVATMLVKSWRMF